MGDVDANIMKTLLEILSKSSLPAPKIEALEFLLGTFDDNVRIFLFFFY